MAKTAGFTRMKTKYLSEPARVATIELSSKVIDDEDRLKETLLHEMCHVAAFLIDEVTKRECNLQRSAIRPADTLIRHFMFTQVSLYLCFCYIISLV